MFRTHRHLRCSSVIHWSSYLSTFKCYGLLQDCHGSLNTLLILSWPIALSDWEAWIQLPVMLRTVNQTSRSPAPLETPEVLRPEFKLWLSTSSNFFSLFCRPRPEVDFLESSLLYSRKPGDIPPADKLWMIGSDQAVSPVVPQPENWLSTSLPLPINFSIRHLSVGCDRFPEIDVHWRFINKGKKDKEKRKK